MEELLEVLNDIKDDVDYETCTTLIDDGILDSLTITGIIALLSMEFDITIPYEEIIEDNFNSIAGLAGMVERLQ